MISTFTQVQEFLESWGLHFDTPEGESNDIPYPQVYLRMKEDAEHQGGENFSKFISTITDTTDGRTYLTASNWSEVQDQFEHIMAGW